MGAILYELPKIVAPEKPEDCEGCSLETLGGKTWSRPEGRGTRKVMICAEALGRREQEDGLPLRPDAQAGSVIESVLTITGLSREEFVLWNIVGCRPPNNELSGAEWEVGAINHCQRHFQKVMERFEPKVILATGNIPFHTLTGMGGEKMGVTAVRGFAFDSSLYPGVTVVPTYHPAFLARGKMKWKGVMRRDLWYACKIAQEGRKKLDYSRYKIFPEREVVEEYIRHLKLHPTLPIFHDIETQESITGKDESELEKFDRITQIQFCSYEGESIVLPWAWPFDDLSAQILALPNPKIGWNAWEFDLPHYQQYGLQVNGVLDDSMWKWFFWQSDLPRGLQFATAYCVEGAEAWKHISSSDPGLYGGHDTNYNLLVDRYVEEQLSKKGLLGRYQSHVRDLRRIHLRMAKERGIPINVQKMRRLEAALDETKTTKLSEMQALVPQDLLNIQPKEGYVREPKDTTGMVKRTFLVNLPETDPCPECQGTGSTTKLIGKLRSELVECSECAGEGCLACGFDGVLTVNTQKTKLGKCGRCKGKGMVERDEVRVGEVERWCRLIPFKPSQDQLLRYAKAKKHPVPTVKEKGEEERETTGKNELMQLFKKTGDPLYGLALEYREVEKLKGTYVWYPGGNRGERLVQSWERFVEEMGERAEEEEIRFLRSHTFRYSAATGQLAAIEPNVLTFPKRGKVAKDWREAIEAPPGKMIVEADHTAFHAKTLGFEARCLDYMRIASLDIHSFLTCHVLKVPEAERLFGMKDEELAEILGWYRKQEKVWFPSRPGEPKWTFQNLRDFRFKPVVLGVGFGEGAEKIAKLNPDAFRTKTEAEVPKKVLKGLFPKIFKYQDEQVVKAYRQKYLISKYRYVRMFWDAMRYDPRNKRVVNSDQAEPAMAFEPANDAHGMFKDEQIRMEKMGWGDRWGMFLPVHDALYFLPEEGEAEECAAMVKKEMEEPCSVLVNEVAPEGFRCGAEVKIGRNLREMKEWRPS